MPETFQKKLKEEIEKAEIITLFRHQYPDPDAYGSQLGLKAWLQTAYPHKTILALGAADDPLMDTAADEQIADSLAILLDASTSARIEDPRWKLAGKSARIDHHIPVEEIADLEWIDTDATATCEMAALLLKEWGADLPQEAAQKLYEGLIADNLRFSVEKTRPESFEAAAWLLAHGVDVVKAAKTVFARDYASYQYENSVRSKSFRSGSVLFSVMDCQDYLRQGLSFSSAKDKVYALADISEIEIWALFTQMEDGIHYAASLRSRTIPIRDIAAQYNGGGHDCASGIKNLSPADVSAVIEKLIARSKEQAAA